MEVVVPVLHKARQDGVEEDTAEQKVVKVYKDFRICGS